MPRTTLSPGKRPAKRLIFNVQAFLDTAGVARKVVEFRKKQSVYSQGESADTVMYIQKGAVKLSVINEIGKEAVVASIRAHGTGKNLQQFARAHVANPPSDGATWEQLLGRLHRTGQEADEVTFSTYRHTEAFRAAVEKARDLSEYIEGTLGTTQRLASVASWGF